MSNTSDFNCLNCSKYIRNNIRNIFCHKCNKYVHVKCTDITTKEYNNLLTNNENWTCQNCRPHEKRVKCRSCKKSIQINNTIINCSICGNFFHSKCSSISFEKFGCLASWTCDYCVDKNFPFSSLDTETLFLTMQGKDSNIGEHITLSPSFNIQTLLDKISNNDTYISDITNSEYFTPSQFVSAKFSKDAFSMFHLNIASIALHLDELKTLLSILDHPFDILAISETKILEDSDPISNIFIEGYNFVHTPTKTDKGGVGLFIKNELNFKLREDLNKSIFNIGESVFVEIESKNAKNALVGCIYRHHTPIKDFLEKMFEGLLIKISNEKNKKCAFLGDYNIDLLHVEHDDKSCEFYDIFSNFGFRPLILQPTRVQTTSISTSATLIDNIYVNDCENVSTGGNITTSISDHFPQFCIISDFLDAARSSKNSPRFGRSFKHFNKDEFEKELNNVDWVSIFQRKNADDCTSFLVNQVEHLLDELAPMKRLTNREVGLKQRPWITPDILRKMKERDKFYNKYTKEIDPNTKNIIFQVYKKKRNEVVNIIRHSKNEYYANFFELNKCDMKKTWEGIRDVVNISKKSNTTPSNITYKNVRHDDCEGMANCFNDFFVNIGNTVEANIPQGKKTFFYLFERSK